jgi:hypothetical protein
MASLLGEAPIMPQLATPSGKAPAIHWTAKEDWILADCVARFGLGEWNRIAHHVGHGRTRAQCAQRWFRCIDPSITKGRWESEEDDQLLQIVQRLGGKNWVQIAREMKTRSDVQCRHRYLYLERQQRQEAAKIKIALPSIESLLEPLF